MKKTIMAGLAIVAWLGAASGVLAQATAPSNNPPALPPPVDFADKANWLCWPGKTPNACDVDLTTTVVEGGGATRVEPFRAEAAPLVDCFYVYPTVSTDPGALATTATEPAELRVVEQQLARFGASCRLYAPVYRQVTLTALFSAMMGHPLPGIPEARRAAYDDVRDAWNYYLAHANHGRGVVLIGHSQGSTILTQLLAREIDGRPVQKQLVSAILMGTSLAVPQGKDVGGAFQSIPLCHADRQTGCVIAFASFRDTTPPQEDSLFGRPRPPGPDLVAACVNPANLAGGEGELQAYLASGSHSIAAGGTEPAPVWAKGKTITTPFVSLPGMLAASCVSTPAFHYLAVHVTPDPTGGRTNDINGDVMVNGKVLANWGLHLIDANLAMGNLVGIVANQSRAWKAEHR